MYYDLVTDAIMETCSVDLTEKSHMKRMASDDSATPFASVVVIKCSCRRYRNPCPLFPQGITNSSYYAQTGNESRPENLDPRSPTRLAHHLRCYLSVWVLLAHWSLVVRQHRRLLRLGKDAV
jgi:hypothetical protein